MPYDPTIDPPDVVAERRPRGLDEPPVDCQWCGDLLSVVNENGEAWFAECDNCSATVISIYAGVYTWTTPRRALEVLAHQIATMWPFTADRAALLEGLSDVARKARKERDVAREAKGDREKARKGVA